jgi:calpain-6
LYGENFDGHIELKFWLNNEWIVIYIDDLLPTIDGQLYYSRSSNYCHFWVPLIEKAFAKYSFLSLKLDKILFLNSSVL